MYGTKGSNVLDIIKFAARVKSVMAIKPSIDVSLNSVINSLDNDGSAFFMACGIIMSRIFLNALNPTDRPASVCPLSTAIMPPRIISQTYAPEFTAKASTAIRSGGVLRPGRIICHHIKSCTTKGVPRITVTYTEENHRKGANFEMRMKAKIKPIKIPNNKASIVTCAVVDRPFSKSLHLSPWSRF